jgi:multimeric flavodoxin WrbA
MKNTVALFASSRRNGNTGQLMDRIAAELNIEVIDLAEKKISAYDYAHRNRDDDFESLMEYVLKFDQIIFSSPVYWYAVSPPMKIFLDRISDFLVLPDLLETGRRLRGKTGYVVCTSIAEEIDTAYINAFEKTFKYLGMHFGGFVHANCCAGYKHDDYKSDVEEFIHRLNSSNTSLNSDTRAGRLARQDY